MEESFPIDERRSYDKQKNLLSNPYYSIYGIQDKENIVCFLAIWEFSNFVFIEHFATNPKYRNQGIGAKALKECTQLIHKPFCLEVELPDNELAMRRIHFYQRNDFCLNDYDYMQPSYEPNQEAIPLKIMTLHQSISKEQFQFIKNILYKEVYNIK